MRLLVVVVLLMAITAIMAIIVIIITTTHRDGGHLGFLQGGDRIAKNALFRATQAQHELLLVA